MPGLRLLGCCAARFDGAIVAGYVNTVIKARLLGSSAPKAVERGVNEEREMRNGQRAAMAAFACAATIGVAACGSSGDSDTTTGSGSSSSAATTTDGKEKLTLGMSPPADSEFYQLIKNGVDDCSDGRIELKYQTPTGHQAVEEQQSILEGWLNQDLDAIAVTTVGDVSALDQLYSDATEKGVGMYFLNMAESQLAQVDRADFVASVGYNNYDAAEELGAWVRENIGTSGKVAVLLGTPGVHTTDRLDGFVAGAGNGWEVVAKQQADWVRDRGQTVAETMLQANPDIDLIYAQNDEMGLGAVQAVAGRDMQDDVRVVSLDGVRDAVAAVETGELAATMNVLPRDQGCQLARDVLAVADGRRVPQIDDVDVHVTDETNVAEDRKAFE